MRRQVNARGGRGSYWGFQRAAVFEVGTPAGTVQGLTTLEQAAFGGDAAEPYPHPTGLWRISAKVTQGNADFVGSLQYGTGAGSLRLDSVILPLVAYVPGYAQLSAQTVAGPLAEQCVITTTVTPVGSYGLQQLGTLFDASGGPVVLPQSVIGLTFYAASSYTPEGAPAPIAGTAGQTVDTAGQVVVSAGQGVAWHEL